MSENKMTKAPWQLSTVPFELRNTDSAASIYGPPSVHGGACLIADISRSPGDESATANAAAIVSAINNTYGASINPEALPDMKKVLIELLAQFEKVVEPKYTLDFMLIKEAKAAIEKAKLPTP